VTSSARRWLVALVLALWLSEWLLTWTSHLGVIGEALSWVWLAGLVILVGRSLARTRLPVGPVVWAWMAALLGVTIFRAWWLARAGPLPLFSDPAELERVMRELPASSHADFRWLAQLLELLMTPLAIGLVGAVIAAVEIAIITVALAIGQGARDGPPARVGLLPRIAVATLQLPTLLVIPALGLALVGGTLAGLGAPPTGLDERTLAVIAGLERAAGPALAVGLGLWLLGTIHLRRLLALADGGRLTRLALAGFSILPAALIVIRPGVGWTALLLVWVALQLAALGLARPAATASPPHQRGRPAGRTRN
jgi:hypothetical protein